MKNRKMEILLLVGVIAIAIFGLVMIYSASYIWAEYKFNDPYKFVKNQGIFFIVGVLLMLIISRINYRKYYDKANILLVSCIILLILVLIPGIGTVRNGSRSWFGIGSFGIQPSEFTKLALIIFTSKYLVNNENKMSDIKRGVLPILGLLYLFLGLLCYSRILEQVPL